METETRHLHRLKKGDNSSFEYLYNTWSGKLYNFVMRISNGDSYLSEDIVQQVFIKVWETHSTIDPEKSFGAYICTIAKNKLVNIYQHRIQEFYILKKQRKILRPRIPLIHIYPAVLIRLLERLIRIVSAICKPT